MNVTSTKETCVVSSCSRSALYTCPRCALPYCSVPCYRAHSKPCVDAFSDHAMQSLRGLTTSSAQRRSFNDMLHRTRRVPDPSCMQTQSLHQTHPGEEAQDNTQRSQHHTTYETDLDNSPNDPDQPHVLEQLLDELDEPQRQTLFTVLNSAMENVYGRDSLSSKPSSEERPFADSKSPLKNRGPLNSKAQEGTVSDVLENLVEEMEMIDLSYDEMLSRLPHSLRNDFEKRLRTGSVEELVPGWAPWWQQKQNVTENASCFEEDPSFLPPLPLSSQLIVPLSVPQQKASLCLQYSLVDILAAHASSLRLCNGEWKGDTVAAMSIWQLSSVLSSDRKYKSAVEACNAVKNNIAKRHNHSLAMLALRDVADILSGRSDWVARGLFECQCVLEAVMDVAGVRKVEIRKRVRKTGFILSWSMFQESEVFEQLARAVLSFVDLESGLAEEVKVAARVVKASQTPKIVVLE